MMLHKEFPTLADALVATMRRVSATLIGKKLGPEFVEQHELALKIPHARKFILDERMSAYLCDLGQSIQRGGLRKRITAAENARHQARLPHALRRGDSSVGVVTHDFAVHHDSAPRT
jgi:hypothetical protein